MNKEHYWRWIRVIWHRPTDWQRRLVFADWLEENGCVRAARKQRQYAEWVKRSVSVYLVVEWEQVYFTMTTKGRNFRFFRMKKDGSVNPLPKHVKPYSFHSRWIRTQCLKHNPE